MKFGKICVLWQLRLQFYKCTISIFQGSTSKASAFSCAIEVIVDSTPPKSVHRGDGDRAEFAIQLKMPHTAASSRCFLAGGIVADISRMLTGHGTQSPHST